MTIREAQELLTISEAARKLGISEWRLRAKLRHPDRAAKLVRRFGRVLIPADVYRGLVGHLAARGELCE